MKRLLILLILLLAVAICNGQTGNVFTISNTPAKMAFRISYPDSIIHVTDSAFTGRWVLKLQKEQREVALKAYEWQELYFAFVDVAAHINTPQYNMYLKKWQSLKIKFGK